jgi:Ceramidase
MGMAEPVNTITNAFIILAAYLAYRYVRKSRVPLTADLIALLILLAWTGIGSFLWHGLRQWWALQLDWIPGVLFLLVFTAVWFRQLFGWAVGIGAAVLMLVVAVASVRLAWPYFDTLRNVSPNLRFTPAFATIAIIAAALVAATARKYGSEAGRLGIIILSCALAAAVFRSIDLIVCPIIPTGTHFLWHILLSTASWLGIVLVVKMKRARASETPGIALPSP